MKLDVSITKARSYDEGEVYVAIKNSVDLLGGMSAHIRPGERVLLKPNLLSGKPPEAAVTTHPSVVKAVIRLVKEAGGRPFVADSPALGNARKAAQACGVLKACADEGVELLDLSDPVVVENREGRVFRRIEIARSIAEHRFDAIINLPKLKTHAQMYLTLAVKNLFGCVPGAKKAQWHLTAGVDNLRFASMLLELCLYLKPRLNIMDAIVGMEGNGPGNGTPKDIGLVLASVDPVAMDSICAELLGANEKDVPTLLAARQYSCPGAFRENVNVLGHSVKDLRVSRFSFPPPMGANFVEKLPPYIEKRLRKALTTRPHVSDRDCTLCGVCVEVCPADVMRKTDRIDISFDKCIRCFCCQEVCPSGAITPKEGWLKRLIPGL